MSRKDGAHLYKLKAEVQGMTISDVLLGLEEIRKSLTRGNVTGGNGAGTSGRYWFDLEETIKGEWIKGGWGV